MNKLKVLAENFQSQIVEKSLINLRQLESYRPTLRELLTKELKGQGSEVQNRILSEYLGSGPLKNLLEDPLVTEVIVNGPENIFYEKGGELHSHTDSFLTLETFENFYFQICEKIETSPSADTPFATGSWRGFRVQLIHQPVSKNKTICIRKHPKRNWTLEKLLKNLFLTARQSHQLQEAILNEKNILVVGTTGSGKTSLIQALLSEVPKNCRCLILEDSPELMPPNGFSQSLLTRKDPQEHLKEVSLTKLVAESLRLRPDRIILGELRSSEAMNYLLALSTGHKGGLASIHARSAWEAVTRLELLIQMGAPQWSTQSIRKLILSSVELIVNLSGSKEKRKIAELNRISSLEESGFLIEKVD